MIDLHMHTTASDGRLTPAALVARVAAAGITIFSVTDHDTVGALAEARQLAAAANLTCVPGIEITAVHDQKDVHVLGYFFDEGDRALARFLETSRSQRVERAREIADRLARLGCPVAIDRILSDPSLRAGSSIGRPLIARALVQAGHVQSVQEAFDRYLATGRPAFVPRTGCSPAEVVEAIHGARGVASLAHPGVTRQPAIIEPLARAGLDAIEVFHSEHTPEMRDAALAQARALDLGVTGGSDYHGEDDRRPLGGVTLPLVWFEALEARARHAQPPPAQE